MKKISLILAIIIGLVFLSPLFGEDKDEKAKKEENTVDAKITVGVKAEGKDGSTVKVKEYDPLDDGAGPVLKAKINGHTGGTFFNFLSAVKGSFKDQYHAWTADFNRVFKQVFTFNSLYHRLDHDPLANMDVVSHARSAAYVTDYDPTKEYHITRSEFTSSSRVSIPALPFLKVSVDYRNEHRSGEYQARTLSKCSACHLTAKSRAISSFNTDIRIGTALRFGKANFDYSYTHNQFKENEAAPTNFYIKVEHPEKILPVFTSRIGVGNEETLPFDNIPDSTKNTHLFQAAVPFGGGMNLTAQYLYASVENVNAGIQWETNSFAGGFSSRLGKKGFFNLRVRQIKIDNDTVFIDVNEPLDVAGPKVGQTYAGAYGVGTFDFNRYSSLSRTEFDLDANLRYNLAKGLRLRLGYEYNSIEREYYDVDSTKSSTFKGQLTYKPVKTFKIILEGKYKGISDPFANLNGGIAPLLQTEAYDNPFAGTQFFYWHQQRAATLTNYPESVAEVKGRFVWSPTAKFSFSGNVLSRSEKNDNLNYAGISWNRDMTQWGLDMWLAPSKKFMASLAFHNYMNNYSSVFAIAAVEGCGAGFVGGMTGTLTDMMDYDITSRTFLVNLYYLASSKLTVFCNFNYNKSDSMIKNLSIDVSQVPYLPGNAATALNFDNYGGVAEYSKLDMKQMIGELGFKYDFSHAWALNGSFFYYFYDDLAQYLFTDTTGKSYSFYAGLTWSN